jgi:hypothetical protein
MIANILIADRYNLKIGWISVDQYYILVGILSKPWTKTQCVGFGGLLAFIYFHIRRYRDAQPSKEKKARFHKIDHLMTSPYLGKGLMVVGSFLITINLVGVSSYF